MSQCVSFRKCKLRTSAWASAWAAVPTPGLLLVDSRWGAMQALRSCTWEPDNLDGRLCPKCTKPNEGVCEVLFTWVTLTHGSMIEGFRPNGLCSIIASKWFLSFFSSLICVTRLILTSFWSRVSIVDMLSGVAMASHGQRRGWLDLVQPISGSYYFLGCFSMWKVCHRFASVWIPSQLRLLQCRREHQPRVHPNCWR